MFSLVLIILALAICPIILLTTIILLATKKSKESFEKKIRAIYVYIIILACIIGIIICVINLINTVTDILLPSEDIESYNSYYRNLVLYIGTTALLVPLSIYHKKKI